MPAAVRRLEWLGLALGAAVAVVALITPVAARAMAPRPAGSVHRATTAAAVVSFPEAGQASSEMVAAAPASAADLAAAPGAAPEVAVTVPDAQPAAVMAVMAVTLAQDGAQGVGSGGAAGLAAPGAAPESPGVREAVGPVQAVTGFYAAVGQHRFDQAVLYWSPGMRAAYPPPVYLYDRFSQTRQMIVRRADVTTMDSGAGRATVAVSLEEASSVPAFNRTWRGTWYLVRTATGWQLDRPSFRV